MGMLGRFQVTVCALLLIVPAVPAGLGGQAAPSVLEPTAPAPHAGVVEDGLWEDLDEPQLVIVHAGEHEGLDRVLERVDAFEIVYRFANLPAAAGLADRAVVEQLADRREVSFVEDGEKQLDYHLNSATIASRAREVFNPSFEPPEVSGIEEPSPPQLGEDGSPIDGEGIGIAVVDSGIDTTHPGLDEGKVVANHVVTPEGVQEAGDYTELGSGHGTRMAGIAAGTGEAAPERDLRGAAPGASLYGFAVEPQGTTLMPSIAFDWLLSNGDEVEPKVRVVLNGWSCGDLHCGDDEQAHLQLARQLAEQGFVVVFPVGNGHGEGLHSATTTESTLDTPGILGVANADDDEIGTRSDCIDHTSSRGNAFDPATWPDLAAPGEDVVSPQAVTASQGTRTPASPSTTDPTSPSNAYTSSATATSFSAAHAAGVAALVLRANPSLNASQLEYVLETTAHEMEPLTQDGACPIPFVRADPANPGDGANFAAGHGLVDAMDAVELARNFTGIPETTPKLETIPPDFTQEGPVVSPRPGEAFYLEGDQLTESAPNDTRPQVQVAPLGGSLTYTTAPLDSPVSLSAAYGEVWVGTGMELLVTQCVTIEVEGAVYEIDGDTGDRIQLGTGGADLDPVAPGGPWLHEIPVIFEDGVTLDPGDRLEFSLSTPRCTGAASSLSPNPLVVYSGSKHTPSRLLLGDKTKQILPGTIEACQEIDDNEDQACAWIGGVRQHVPLRELEGVYKVEWFGPPGSGGAVHAGGSEAVCTVPGEQGDPWGHCEAAGVVEANSLTSMQNVCTYFTEDGTQVDGEGLCTFVR